MKYISTTDLRTKAPLLRDSLKRGERTYLVHRSEIIAVVEPIESSQNVVSSASLEKVLKDLTPKKSHTSNQRKNLYLKHLDEKYGKDLS